MSTNSDTVVVATEAELDKMQQAYKLAVKDWVIAIQEEEALAWSNHSVAQIDRWEQAHFVEEAARTKAKAAKRDYESALRSKYFDF